MSPAILKSFVIAVLCLPLWAGAAEFHDPTRPAPAFLPGASSAPQSTEAAEAFALEAVQRSSRRATALINGRRLVVGDHIGAYRLESLGADTAVLVSPSGRRVLRVAAAVKKQDKKLEAASSKPVEGERKP
ncbi:MAG: hypothetical protein QM776_03805 [Rhodocyclaceae bacterium]